MKSKNYQRFLLMLVLSFIIMYLVMFLNVNALGNVYFSLTRTYMALLMVSPMALLMLLLMSTMYKNKTFNRLIVFSSIGIFVLALVFLRNQIPIQDEQYMKAMIPHHSSAILVSKNADLKDSEVKKLAVQIIKAQEEEIKKMEEILKRLKK